jgi:hypothetical protein
MSNEIGIGNTTTIDLDNVVEGLTTAEYVEAKNRRGRKGQAAALIERLSAGQIIDVYIVDNKELVERLRESFKPL